MAIEAVMREKAINFLDVTPETSHKWALMNKGIESASVAYNATTNTRHYIADANATTTYTGNAKQLDVTQYAYKGDDTFDYIDDLFYYDKKGSDTETNLLQVFLYRAAEGATSYPAKVQPVMVVLDTHGGDGGDQLQLGYNVMFNGDPKYGIVTITDGVPVFTETSE